MDNNSNREAPRGIEPNTHKHVNDLPTHTNMKLKLNMMECQSIYHQCTLGSI